MALIQSPGKVDINRLAFAAAAIVAMVLVAMGKLPFTALAAFLPWLAPSPMQPMTPAQDDGHADHVDNSP